MGAQGRGGRSAGGKRAGRWGKRGGREWGTLFGLTPWEKRGVCSQEWGPRRGPRGLLASVGLHPANSIWNIILKMTH